MRTRFLVGAAAAYVACAGCIAAFAARPTPFKQLLSMAAFLAVGALLLAGLAWFLTRKKTHRLRSVAPLLVALAAIPAGLEVGHAIRDWQFQRDRPRYQAAATWASSLAVRGETVTVLPPPPEYADLAYAVQITQDDACGVLVDFFWGQGFPVKHTIRRYASDPSSIQRKACLQDWRLSKDRAEGWYELSD